MNRYIVQYFKCPESYINLSVMDNLSDTTGFFRFGDDVICYGRLSGPQPMPTPEGDLPNIMNRVTYRDGITYLPFDATEVIDNLRHELYATNSGNAGSLLNSTAMKIYYLVRPIIPALIRKHLQKAWLTYGESPRFPHWPVDHTIESLLRQLLLLALRSQNQQKIPFIWFWPHGAPSCAVMTHDVETRKGRDFCSAVMDLDDKYGIKAAFSIVPERRYEVTPGFLDSITTRGFELIIQGLNHDGYLFRNHEEYLKSTEAINAYGAQYRATGFRSPVLYRNQAWFDALKFSYDSSVPSVGHLEPQRGGCCTVMPYFIGNILELPVTTTQDYALFNYLNTYTLTLWERQTELIMEQHGLMNFIIHPDYITKPREQNLYKDLLSHLNNLRGDKGLWISTPTEVDHWWRQRANMKLIESTDGVRIEGEGSERARIAFSSEENGKLVFTLQE
jgi:hypothetical protein